MHLKFVVPWLLLSWLVSACGDECDPERHEGKCVGGKALVCDDGKWVEVLDGPCFPAPPDRSDAGGVEASCYSPTQHVERAHEDGALGCSCEETKANRAGYCVDGVALICDEATWHDVADGPCWPPGLLLPGKCEELGGEVLAVPPRDVPLDSSCPDGRRILGAFTTDDGEAPCCQLP